MGLPQQLWEKREHRTRYHLCSKPSMNECTARSEQRRQELVTRSAYRRFKC